MSKEFEVAVIISAKFVACYLYQEMKQALVDHKLKDDRNIVAAIIHWVVTQNMDSINREYKNLFQDIKLTLMWRRLCGKAFG